MKKKNLLVLGLALLVLATALGQPVEARREDRTIKIWIDDFYIMSDVHPFVEGERTFVPIRFIAEELGYQVDWDGASNTVYIEANNKKMSLEIGSRKVQLDGQVRYLELPARLKEARTFVPFRAIAELFGEEVAYDSVNRIAIIGDEYKADGYYPLKYYLKNQDPFIPVFKLNFVDYMVRFSDGRLFRLGSDDEIFRLVDREGSNYQDLDFKSQVDQDKQVYDRYYVAPLEEDPFVGSWHGITTTVGTQDYYDNYVYIEKDEDGDYIFTARAIKDNGSELITESKASYNKTSKTMMKKDSHKTIKATGDFDSDWYSTSGNYKVKDFNYMYVPSDQKLFLKKY